MVADALLNMKVLAIKGESYVHSTSEADFNSDGDRARDDVHLSLLEKNG